VRTERERPKAIPQKNIANAGVLCGQRGFTTNEIIGPWIRYIM
jgi:hypothetical protein